MMPVILFQELAWVVELRGRFFTVFDGKVPKVFERTTAKAEVVTTQPTQNTQTAQTTQTTQTTQAIKTIMKF